MSKWEKVLVVKPDNLSVVLEIHIEGENWLLQLVLHIGTATRFSEYTDMFE